MSNNGAASHGSCEGVKTSVNLGRTNPLIQISNSQQYKYDVDSVRRSLRKCHSLLHVRLGEIDSDCACKITYVSRRSILILDGFHR